MVSMMARIRAGALIYSAVMVLLLIGVACGAASEEPAAAPAQQPAAVPAAQQQQSAAASQSQSSQPAQAAAPAASQPSSASSAALAPEKVVSPTPTTAPEQAKVVAEVVVVDDAPYGILRIANKDLGPPQFLPKNMAVPQATYVSPVIFDALWRMSPERELQNDLLEDWSVSEDGTTWRLQLKEGIPYHKGWGTANIQDLMWVVNQIMLEEARHPGKTNMRRIFQRDETDTTITIIDDMTVEINTGTHQAFDFIWRFQQFGANNFIPLASKAYADDVGDEQATLEGIGTGPLAVCRVPHQRTVHIGSGAGPLAQDPLLPGTALLPDCRGVHPPRQLPGRRVGHDAGLPGLHTPAD